MKQLTRFTVLALLSVVSWAGSGKAAQENFEIRLNELRPGPVGSTKVQAPIKRDKSGGFSIYTVRPGDHLFAILMQRYILSNEAAEQLIPEVMKLNNIRNPKVLTIGQQLKIPLPAPPDRQTRTTLKQTTPAPDQTATPALYQTAQSKAPASQATRQLSVKKPAPQKQPVDTSSLHDVSISAAHPCILANDILKHLHLLNPPTKLISGEKTIMAEHAGIKLVISCGLSPDKSYTYERLLAHNEMQLLVFTGTESSRYVIRKLANRLSLSCQQLDPDATEDLPLTYHFPAIGPNGQDMRLTIAPAKYRN